MDQMHDELLKLEGQSSSLNGSKSFLVSSVEDFGWETVGPKNKYVVTRTQSFIPSELNDIFLEDNSKVWLELKEIEMPLFNPFACFILIFIMMLFTPLRMPCTCFLHQKLLKGTKHQSPERQRLLKNPDLVFSLTAGQFGNISNEKT